MLVWTQLMITKQIFGAKMTYFLVSSQHIFDFQNSHIVFVNLANTPSKPNGKICNCPLEKRTHTHTRVLKGHNVSVPSTFMTWQHCGLGLVRLSRKDDSVWVKINTRWRWGKHCGLRFLSYYAVKVLVNLINLWLRSGDDCGRGL